MEWKGFSPAKGVGAGAKLSAQGSLKIEIFESLNYGNSRKIRRLAMLEAGAGADRGSV